MTNNVIEVLQEARSSKDSGTILILPVNGSSDQPGEIEIRNGRVQKVQFGALTGREALESLQAADNLEAFMESASQPTESSELSEVSETEEEMSSMMVTPANPQVGTVKEGARRGIQIRTKMLLLFSVLPVLMLTALGIFYVTQINSLSQTLQSESEAIIRGIAEDSIRQKSVDVAEEVDRYLRDNIGMDKAKFHKDKIFTTIIEDEIGETGYSVLLEAPFDGKESDFQFWTHPNEKLIAVKFGQLKKALGENYDGTRKILEEVVSNGRSQAEGYYTWIEKDGSVNDKYMVITRVGRTPYIIAATTYIKEFTQPMQQVAETSKEFVSRTRFVVMSLVTLAILILATIVTKYGNKISDKINSLSTVAEKISKGDFTVDIEGRSENDELGALARSVERLRMSVKIMYDRLSN